MDCDDPLIVVTEVLLGVGGVGLGCGRGWASTGGRTLAF